MTYYASDDRYKGMIISVFLNFLEPTFQANPPTINVRLRGVAIADQQDQGKLDQQLISRTHSLRHLDNPLANYKAEDGGEAENGKSITRFFSSFDLFLLILLSLPFHPSIFSHPSISLPSISSFSSFYLFLLILLPLHPSISLSSFRLSSLSSIASFHLFLLILSSLFSSSNLAFNSQQMMPLPPSLQCPTTSVFLCLSSRPANLQHRQRASCSDKTCQRLQPRRRAVRLRRSAKSIWWSCTANSTVSP